MDFAKGMEITETFKGMAEENAGFAKAVLCMCIDQVAYTSGVKSVELLNEISPIIAEANETYGTEGLL